jgi:hypothetical protein
MLAFRDASTRRILSEILPSVRLLTVLHPEYSQSRVRRSYAPNRFCLSRSLGGVFNSIYPSLAELLAGPCIFAVRWRLPQTPVMQSGIRLCS